MGWALRGGRAGGRPSPLSADRSVPLPPNPGSPTLVPQIRARRRAGGPRAACPSPLFSMFPVDIHDGSLSWAGLGWAGLRKVQWRNLLQQPPKLIN